MKLGIMQPYFFPYLGYFQLIYNVDLLIVYDTVQFSTGGWINRNRILHPSSGWQYITVPLEKASYRNHIERAVPVSAVRLSSNIDWRQRLILKLEHYHDGAPYFKETMELFHECLVSDCQTIAQLNVIALVKSCARLDINFNYCFASELHFNFAPSWNAQEKVIHMCNQLGASEYINLSGGHSLYDETSFAKRGIRLLFCELLPLIYDCGSYEFVSHLSIIDLFMWLSPNVIRDYLDECACG